MRWRIEAGVEEASNKSVEENEEEKMERLLKVLEGYKAVKEGGRQETGGGNKGLEERHFRRVDKYEGGENWESGGLKCQQQ